MMSSSPVRRALLPVAATVAVLAACSSAPPPSAGAVVPASAAAEAAAPQQVERVLAISIDGLNPDALTQLGREGAPAIWRLVDRGVHTFEARTAVELTDTLPNHTAMVTGRAIARGRNGHGVTWNDERTDPRTVQAAAGEDVGSVFSEVGDAGRSSALFTTKEKLRLFDRSWPDAVDRVTVVGQDEALVTAAHEDLVQHHRAFTFVHLGGADISGHNNGFMSPAYLATVSRLDGLVGRLVRAVRRQPQLAGTVVVLTADHGGRGESHRDPTQRVNYRVPFVVWGPQVGTGDLYGLQGRTYAAPGRAQVGYGARTQPVRNGDVANLSLDLLGLGPVPDSRFDARQRLLVH